MSRINASLLTEFAANNEYLKNSILSETDSKLKEFAVEITRDNNAALKKQLVEASNLTEFEDVINRIVGQIGLKSTDVETFKEGMISEYEKYFNKAQLAMTIDKDNKFMELTQQLTAGFETQGHENAQVIASDIAKSLIKLSNGESTNKKINVKNVNDMKMEMSLDYLKKEGKVDLLNNIQNQYDISSTDKVAPNGDSVELLKKFDELNSQIIEEKKILKFEYARQHKVLEQIDAKNDPEAYVQQTELLKEIENSINYLNAIQDDQLKQIKKKGMSGAVNPKTLKNLESQISETDKLNKSMEEATGMFGSMNKASQSLGNQFANVTKVADAMSDVFSATGTEMKSMGNLKGVSNGFTDILSSGILSMGAFVGALGIATKMVGMYHEQLNISREMGDNSGGLVKDLQKMHIKTLMDPGQLKALSDQIGGEFGVSLTKDQKEMQKVAVKQRLAERVMGKEYAADQITAMTQLKNVLVGNSPSAMMDTLANQTSALAKTMGISNKMALEQIKRLDENTKVLTQGLNKDMAAEIQKTFRELEAGLVAAGLSKETAAEITKTSSEILADKDALGKEQMKINAMISQGGAGGEAMQKAFADAGVSQTEALTLMARTQLVGFNNLSKEEKAKMQKITAGSQIAQAIQMEAWQKILDDPSKKNTAEYQEAMTKKLNADTMGYKANSGIANSTNKDGIDKFYENMDLGKEVLQKLEKGENSTQDLNAILISMGATDNNSRLAKMDELIKAMPKEKDSEFKDMIQSVASLKEIDAKELDRLSKSTDEADKEKYLALQIDAYKATMADSIKAVISTGDGSQLGKGVKIDGNAAKAVRNSDDFANTSASLTNTTVETAQDTAETAATKGLYALQNATMSLVDGALKALSDALTFLTNNIGLVTAALVGLGLSILALKLGSALGGTLKAISSISNVVGGFGVSMTKGVISAQKLVFNGTTKILGGMSNLLLKGVSGIFGKAGEGIKNVFGPIMSSVTEKIGPIFDSLKDKLGSVFSGISEKFKGFNFGKESKLIGPALPPGMKEPEDDSTFWEKTKKQWGSFKGSLGKGMLSLGRMVGPMAVAGAAMVAFEGALEGWGKAGEWFGSTIELGDKMKTKSKENEVLAKSIDPSATWDEVKKAYVNASGEIIRTSADMMKIGPVAVKTAEEIAKMTDAERKKYEEDLKLSQSAEEMAKSFSKTGTAIWDGTKYVDQYGRSIEATATIGQKTASAIGGALEAVSFGMLDGQHMAHKTAEIFKSIGDWFDSNGLTDTLKSLKSAMGDYYSALFGIYKSIFNLLSPLFDVAKTVFGGIVQYIAGIFKIITGIFTLDLGKMSEGVKTIMNGFIDIVTWPLKLVVGIIDKLFGTDLMSTFNTVIDVVKSFYTMVIDVFTGIIRAVGDILGGIIDVITAPFKALMAWFNGEMDFSDAFSSMLDSLGEGIKKIGKGLVDIVASPFNSFIDWITDKLSFILGSKEEQQAENIAKNASEEDKLAGDKLSKKLDLGGWSDMNEDKIRKKVSEQNLTEKDIMQMISGDKANDDEKEALVKILNEMKQGFISATEENVKAGKSKEDIKDGDKLAKKLKINGMWDTSEETIRERLTKHNISSSDIEKLIAANDTSSDEKDILLKILNERKQAESAKGAKVEVTALPAKAEGGSTGGLGDVFAKMIMPDLTKETPVATVGTDEFVFSKEMIQNAMKAKEASTGTSFSGISNVGQTLSNTASGVFEINKSIIDSIGSILTGEDGPVEAFQYVGNTMASLLPETTEYIVKGLGENASATISGISSIGGIIVDSFKGILDGKTSLSEGILTVGDTIGEKAITPLQDTFENFSEGISDTFMGFANMFGNAIRNVKDKAIGFVENVKSEGFVSAVKGAVADVSDWGAEKINNIKQSSKDNLELVRNAMKKQGFNNENYINATLGNVMKESGGKVISENLNYRTTSNDRIKSIFKSATAGKSDAEISAAKQNPQTFAEFVYGASTERGKAMGNTAPGDGWKYRGRGFIQLTGKNNYAAASKAIYKDDRLVENPDLVNNPEIAAEVTAWYMKTNTARMEEKTGINAETASLEDSTMLATSTIGGFNMQSQNGYQKELFGKSYSYAKHIANEPKTNSSIPPDKSVKIASNNIVAQGTAQQVQSTVNNTTNNNTTGTVDNQALNKLVAINQAQLNYQNKMAQEAYRQTKQSQKDYKADIDRNDQARILEIANRKV